MDERECPLIRINGINGDRFIESLEARLERVEEALVKVADSLKVLTRVDALHDDTRNMVRACAERQDRFDTDLRELEAAIEERLRALELKMPGLTELRRWIVSGVAAAVGILITAAVALITKT